MTFRLQSDIKARLDKQGLKLSLRHPNFSAVSKQVAKLLVTHFKLADTWEINHGYCFIWAFLCSLYNPALQLVSTTGHACVRYEGNLWDCDGVNTTARMEAGVTQTPSEFVAYWERVGRQKTELKRIAITLLAQDDRTHLVKIRHILYRGGFSPYLMVTKGSLNLPMELSRLPVDYLER